MVLPRRHALEGLAKVAVFVGSVSLKNFNLLLSFTPPFVLWSWFRTLLSFVNFQFGFRLGSEGRADVVHDWIICSTDVAVFHRFVLRWFRLPVCC